MVSKGLGLSSTWRLSRLIVGLAEPLIIESLELVMLNVVYYLTRFNSGFLLKDEIGILACYLLTALCWLTAASLISLHLLNLVRPDSLLLNGGVNGNLSTSLEAGLRWPICLLGSPRWLRLSESPARKLTYWFSRLWISLSIIFIWLVKRLSSRCSEPKEWLDDDDTLSTLI